MRIYFCFLCNFILSVAHAQVDNTVNVVRDFEPTIKQSYKTIESANLPDSNAQKKIKVTYNYLDTKASLQGFEPMSSTLADIKVQNNANYNSPLYIRLGASSLKRPFAEIHGNLFTSSSLLLYTQLEYQAAEFDNPDPTLFTKAKNTQLGATIGLKKTFYSNELKANVGYQKANFSYFDVIPDLGEINIDNIQSIYSKIHAEVSLGSIDATNIKQKEGLHYTAKVNAYQLKDQTFGPQERHISVSGKVQFNLASFYTTLEASVDNYNANIPATPYVPATNTNLPNTIFQQTVFHFLPSIAIQKNGIHAKAGIAIWSNIGTMNQFYAFPVIDATYKINNNLLLKAKLDADYQLNSMDKLRQENPMLGFITQYTNTITPYRLKVGVEAKSNAINYGVNVCYQRLSGTYFYLHNWSSLGNRLFTSQDTTSLLQPTIYFNYDKKNIQLTAQATYFAFGKLRRHAQAYEVPTLQATLQGKVFFTEKLYTEISLKILANQYTTNIDSVGSYKAIKAKSAVLLDAELGYHFQSNIGVFVKGHNLLNASYSRYLYYGQPKTYVTLGVWYTLKPKKI